MKLPNGYGTIARLSGNRRRPYAIKEGRTGKQKVIGYATTQEEGLYLLAKYNRNQWSGTHQSFTFLELHELWEEKRACKLGVSNQKGLKAIVKYCTPIYHLKYGQIKAYHMQECIDVCGHGYATQNAIRNLFYHLDRFALELDLITKSYAQLLTTQSPPASKKKIFTPDERTRVWEVKEQPWMFSILLLLYTGFRFSELLSLEKAKVDLVNRTFTGGIKTEAGRDRIIPIHSKIFPMVEHCMAQEGVFLLCKDGNPCTKTQYRYIWNKLMLQLEMNHTPHECRHTFRSLLDSAGANKVCIDRLMGHKSVGTGERVYTHKTLEELRESIELITD